MSIIQKIHKSIFSGKKALDSFENALLDILEEKLPESDREILGLQRQFFNKVAFQAVLACYSCHI